MIDATLIDTNSDDAATVAVEIAQTDGDQVIVELSQPAGAWLLVLSGHDANVLAHQLRAATAAVLD